VDGYYVYIMASKRNGTLYVRVTNDLARRVDEHRRGAVTGFTKRYDVYRLVYYEECRDVKKTIEREKQIEEMATGVEEEPHRGCQSRVARSVH